MDEEIREEYERLLVRLVLANGSLVGEDASFYGWHDHTTFRWPGPGFSEHVGTCGIKSTGRVQEDIWYEFKGTFYEGDTSVHGISLKGVTCNCDKVQDREVRWSAPMQEVAEAVFEEHMRTAHAEEVGQWITDAINSDPFEVERLRRSIQNARAGRWHARNEGE